MRRRLGVLAVLAVVILAGCTGAPSLPADDGTTPATTQTTQTTRTTGGETGTPADPDIDVLGWESGYWYNETLTIDRTDGLNDSELDAVVFRSMARVEVVRGLEFQQSVPVEVISRAEYRNRTSERFSGVPVNASLHQNVKFEATFMIGEGTSAIAQRQENRASSVLGYYSPSEDRIVIVSEDGKSPQIDEITLSQELFHALQQHRFNISSYVSNTEERHNAHSGIIEGDANYVDHLYQQRCDAGWQCFTPDSSGGSGGGGEGPHVGLLALQLQPYSDGPVFVEGIREEGGWEAVNAVYENPPQSTEQTIHPERYLRDAPTTVTIEDRSGAAWSVPQLGNDSIEYAQFGEAGMYVMLWYPSYVASQERNAPTEVVVPYSHFFNPQSSSSLDMYNYSYPASAGWDGDRLLPYVREDSAETNETGYVWKSVWDSTADAREFAAAYREVLTYHGAEPVDGRPNTYRIPDGPFADAFSVVQNGDRVVIVNAPTVEALSSVRAGAGTT
ncbi:MAG: Hvo_1808 family surface protein [Halanaeroarchaeum sp.]